MLDGFVVVVVVAALAVVVVVVDVERTLIATGSFLSCETFEELFNSLSMVTGSLPPVAGEDWNEGKDEALSNELFKALSTAL